MVRAKSDLALDFAREILSRQTVVSGRSAGAAGELPGVAVPETLERATHVELRRRNLEPRVRLAFLLVFAAISVAGLANVFGQRPGTTTGAGDVADLALSAPSAVRGGLIYEVRIRVTAHRRLAEPALVFDGGWYEGFTINTFEPEPSEWEHRNGRNAMLYGPVEAGDELEVRLQYQANPTAFGRRSQDLVLEDKGEVIARIDHSATVYP